MDQTAPTGMLVARNIKRLRIENNLNIPELARRAREHGSKLNATSITRLEAGERRIDVDDLMIFCKIFDVIPATLLLPADKPDNHAMPKRAQYISAPVTAFGEVRLENIWLWALGVQSLNHDEDLDTFRARVMPKNVRKELTRQVQQGSDAEIHRLYIRTTEAIIQLEEYWKETKEDLKHERRTTERLAQQIQEMAEELREFRGEALGLDSGEYGND